MFSLCFLLHAPVNVHRHSFKHHKLRYTHHLLVRELCLYYYRRSWTPLIPNHNKKQKQILLATTAREVPQSPSSVLLVKLSCYLQTFSESFFTTDSCISILSIEQQSILIARNPYRQKKKHQFDPHIYTTFSLYSPNSNGVPLEIHPFNRLLIMAEKTCDVCSFPFQV